MISRENLRCLCTIASDGEARRAAQEPDNPYGEMDHLGILPDVHIAVYRLTRQLCEAWFAYDELLHK